MGKITDLTHKVRASFSGNTLTARTLSGGAALLVGEAFSNVIRLGANLIMTRLLYPEAFGVMLVINLVFSALAMLSDVGIRSAIIARKEELSDKFLHVAWTIMILRGVFLGIIAALIAHPIALWYDHPELFELVLVAAIAPVIAGFASPAPRVAERNVKLARVTVWQVGTQALATVCTLTWLFIDPSIWALVAHGIFAAIIQVVLSFVMFPSGRIWFRWDNVLALELFHFGKWVLLGTALTFLGRQGDSLIVSQFLSFEALGVFSIAISFAKLIEMLAEKLSWGLLFPVFSELKHKSHDAFVTQIRKLRLAVYGICFPVVMVLVLGGRDLIRILYDPRYIEAGWMLEVIALGLGFYVLTATVMSLPLSQEESKRHMWVQLCRVVAVLGAMFLGGLWMGVPGLIWGIAAGQVLYYPVLRLMVGKYGVGGYATDIAFGGGSVLVAALVWHLRGWPGPGLFG